MLDIGRTVSVYIVSMLPLTLNVGIVRGRKGRPGITVCWYFRPEQVDITCSLGICSHSSSCLRHFTQHSVNFGRMKYSRPVSTCLA